MNEPANSIPEETPEDKKVEETFPARYAKREKVWREALTKKDQSLRQLQQNNSVLLDKLQRWKKFYERAIEALQQRDRLRTENKELLKTVTDLQTENRQLKEEMEAVRRWAEGEDP